MTDRRKEAVALEVAGVSHRADPFGRAVHAVADEDVDALLVSGTGGEIVGEGIERDVSTVAADRKVAGRAVAERAVVVDVDAFNGRRLALVDVDVIGEVELRVIEDEVLRPWAMIAATEAAGTLYPSCD